MERDFKVKILVCVDCKEEFAFTPNAQEYFAQRGFTEDPKRCRSCYAEYKRKNRRNGDRKPRTQLPYEVDGLDPPFLPPDSTGNGDGDGGLIEPI